MNFAWQIQQPLDAIIFDCDGTLSQLEGINVLAVQNGVGEAVKSLTEDAMSSTGIDLALYEKRLSLVKPQREQVKALGKAYFNQTSVDADIVVRILQKLNKKIFILSAGLKLAVDIFAAYLNIPTDQVYAVDITFDADGSYIDFDRQSPLARTRGKEELVQQLKSRYPALMHVGDGMNDVGVKQYVKRFVGYGGVFFRESILQYSDFYIRSASLSPLLVLALTEKEVETLSKEDRVIYDKGIELISNDDVLIGSVA